MGGRHRSTSRGTPRRLLAGAAGLAIGGAVMLSVGPASAATGTVTATFGVTGVSTSNCSLSTGGSDVYIKPGDELDIQTSVVGMTILGLPLSTSQIAGLVGTMVIDPGKASQHVIPLSATKTTKIEYLTAGNHVYTWTATKVSVLGLTLPLSLDLGFAKAGAALSYQGTMHVTTAAAKCGVAVQLPGPTVSASITGLPPINLSLPPININLPVDPGTILSQIPKPGGPITPPSTGGNSGGSNGYIPPPVSIPEEVVPKGDGGYLGNGAGFFGGALPDLTVPDVAPANLAPAKAVNAAPAKPAKNVNNAHKAPAKKAVEYATNQKPSAQMPVILAIIAIIALTVVTAQYARLYLMRKP